MRIDTSEKGLEAIFKPYEISALRIVFGTSNGATSLEVWQGAKARGNEVSRASIINFCNEMVREGVFENKEITGKGGHRAVYYAKVTPSGFTELIVSKIMLTLTQAFEDKEWWKK